MKRDGFVLNKRRRKRKPVMKRPPPNANANEQTRRRTKNPPQQSQGSSQPSSAEEPLLAPLEVLLVPLVDILWEDTHLVTRTMSRMLPNLPNLPKPKSPVILSVIWLLTRYTIKSPWTLTKLPMLLLRTT